MKQVLTVIAIVAFTFTGAFAQTATELTFKNPVKISGNDRRTGSVYRFYNVAAGTDALLTIASASSESQLVTTLDVSEYGFDKAFQPEIGINSTCIANDNWWVRFNIKFVYSNSNTKRKLSKFYATAIDVDGDSYVIREFIQMYGADSVKYRTPTQLSQSECFNAGLATNSKTSLSRGPVTNYTNIDTAATGVMVTYTFLNTDEINFVYGAKVGNGNSNAGLRLNSLWFKAFNLNGGGTLPFRNEDFSLLYNKAVTLNWKAVAEDGVNNFVVERSEDGVHFTEMTALAFNTRTSQYSYTDNNVTSATGVLYYRIRYTEFTKEARYSVTKVVHLKKDPMASMSVYPNPVKSAANVTLPASWQTKAVVVSVFNASGSLVKTISVKAASQTETLDFTALPRGMYVVKAQCESATAEQRIIKN